MAVSIENISTDIYMNISYGEDPNNIVKGLFINDKEVVLTALKKHGMLLKFLSENLQNDSEVVLAAYKEDKTSAQFASNQVREQLNLK